MENSSNPPTAQELGVSHEMYLAMLATHLQARQTIGSPRAPPNTSVDQEPTVPPARPNTPVDQEPTEFLQNQGMIQALEECIRELTQQATTCMRNLREQSQHIHTLNQENIRLTQQVQELERQLRNGRPAPARPARQ